MNLLSMKSGRAAAGGFNVGPIQGVAPAATRNQQQQQHTTQVASGQSRQPAAPQLPAMQGRNPGASMSQPQATNVQPQQPISHAQGHQQLRFRTPMTTSSQQAQTGNNTFGNVGAGPGRGAPSFGTEGGSSGWFRADPFQNTGTGRGVQPGSSKGKPPQRRG